MKADCPECGAKYNIPEEKLTLKGLATKCAKCNTVFRVFPPEEVPPAVVRKEPEPVKKEVPSGKKAEPDREEIEPGFAETFPKIKENTYDDDLDDFIDDKDFLLRNRPLPRFFAALLTICVLIGVTWIIIQFATDTERAMEKATDRNTYAAANLIKHNVTPEKLIARGIKTYRKSGDNSKQKAIALFKQALEKDPDNLQAGIRVAELKILSGFDSVENKALADEGCIEAKLLLDKNKDNPAAMRANSICLYYNNEKYQAVKLINKAIAQKNNDNGDDAEALLVLAKILYDIGQKDAAFESLKASTKIDMNLFEAHDLLASMFFEKREYNSAVLSQRSACLINPDNYAAKENLTKYEAMLAEMKHDKSGGASYQERIKAARKFRKEGKIKECLNEINEALKVQPGSVTALLMKAHILVDSSPDAALSSASAAARNGSTEAYYLMGSIQQSLGMKSAAISSYENYLMRKPDGSKAYEVKSILKHMKGQ